MATDKQLTGSGALKVNVVTPYGQVASTDTDGVTAPGELGEFEILPGHVPFLTALHPGVLTIGESKKSRFAVSRGYLRVGHSGEIEILVEKAVAADRVDAGAARADLAEAEKELAELKDRPQDGEWRNVKDRVDWAQAQIDAHVRSAN